MSIHTPTASVGGFTVCVIEINARLDRMYFFFAFNVTTAIWNMYKLNISHLHVLLLLLLLCDSYLSCIWRHWAHLWFTYCKVRNKRGKGNAAVKTCLKCVKTTRMGHWHLTGLQPGALTLYFILYLEPIAT